MFMAMTLRLTDDETEALRRRAARENRSMQEVAREAVRRYIESTSKREVLDDAIDNTMSLYGDALRRLGAEE
jgi:plasmid stability protein